MGGPDAYKVAQFQLKFHCFWFGFIYLFVYFLPDEQNFGQFSFFSVLCTTHVDVGTQAILVFGIGSESWQRAD